MNETRFPLLGEALALDLVNTRVCRGGVDVDLLDEPHALVAWLWAESERLAWSGPVEMSDLTKVCSLRDAMDELFHGLRVDERPSVSAVETLNEALSNPGAQPCISWERSGPQLVAPPVGSERAALLHVLAVDAVAVMTGPRAERIRECAHPNCRLQFVANNPRRRWCSDALCGNRARVARHYSRQRGKG